MRKSPPETSRCSASGVSGSGGRETGASSGPSGSGEGVSSLTCGMCARTRPGCFRGPGSEMVRASGFSSVSRTSRHVLDPQWRYVQCGRM